MNLPKYPVIPSLANSSDLTERIMHMIIIRYGLFTPNNMLCRFIRYFEINVCILSDVPFKFEVLSRNTSLSGRDI